MNPIYDAKVYKTLASYRINFKCNFPLTSTVTSDEVIVTQNVNNGAFTGTGTWDNAFDLMFTESDFTTELAASSSRVVGDQLYVAVTFSGTNVPLTWYVNECSVISGSREIVIVRDSCYSEFVRAAFGGTVTSNADVDKKVTTVSTFQERLIKVLIF